MGWFENLLWGSDIAHSIVLLSVVIVLGILLGKIKFSGISLGVTFVLFVGIAFGHFGFTIPSAYLQAFKEFGIILFVYSIGMQVGPGFFSSFKKGGLTLNLLAGLIVFFGCLVTLVLYYITDVPMSTMVGIMSGAVTNTPSMGAGQQVYQDITGTVDETIALGCAIAYPLSVVGVILAMIIIRAIFRIDFKQELKKLKEEEGEALNKAKIVTLVIENPSLFGKTISEISVMINHFDLVLSRIYRHETKEIEIVDANTILRKDDKVLAITSKNDLETVKAFVGREVPMGARQWDSRKCRLIGRRILLTKTELNGKRLGDLKLRQLYHINITRINRAGVNLVASPDLKLQLGDRVNIVGTESSVAQVEAVLGNSMRRLNEPNLIFIFLGIAIGVFLGSIPLSIPGMPFPVKLGLAGGPLLVAIILSRFGSRYKLVTFTTASANLMLREIGITLFLACIGIESGGRFFETIVENNGLMWIVYGFIISIVPLLIVGIMARCFFKVNFLPLMGLLAGSMTDSPALSYSHAMVESDAPTVSYATVYPFSLFLRVLVAQAMILFFV